MMKRRPRAPFFLRIIEELPGRPGDGRTPTLAPKGSSRLNTGRGRLAQLVRASRLHREGLRFESVAAHQFFRMTWCFGRVVYGNDTSCHGGFFSNPCGRLITEARGRAIREQISRVAGAAPALLRTRSFEQGTSFPRMGCANRGTFKGGFHQVTEKPDP
jgi:hypothetical protein